LVFILVVGIDIYLGTGETADPRQKYTDKMAGTTVVRTDMIEDITSMSYLPPPPPPPPPAFATDSTKTEASDTGEGVEISSRDEDKPEEVPEEAKKFMELFNLSEERALNLYKAGYRTIEDFKDAIPEDLIIVDKINPTVARAIIKKVNEEPGDR
jgi:hypothetical protein